MDASAPTPLPGPACRWQPPPFHPISLKNAPARARPRPQPAMEDAIDLDAAAGLASLASSGTVAPSRKGKPRAPCKTATAAKPKKALTPEQRAREPAKRKGRRHAADARDEDAAQAPVVAAAQ